MDFLTFEVEEVQDGVLSLEAMASTTLRQHAAVMAEVQQVLGGQGQAIGRLIPANEKTVWVLP